MARYTYFIQSGDAIRVGSAVRVQLKLEALRKHYKKPFTVACVVPEEMATPIKVCELFEGLKVRRGWLRADTELLYFIQGLRPYLVDPEQLERDRAKPILTPAEQEAREMMSRLSAIRDVHGFNSKIGRICSNLMEQIPALLVYVRQPWASDEKQTLPYMISHQLRRFEQLKAVAP